MSNGVRISSAGALPVLAILLFIVLIIIVIPLLFLGIAGAAFARLGVPPIAALAVVLLMLFGSFVNIPLYRVKRDVIHATVADVPFAPPPVWETVVSLNFGGAVIPLAVSAYLLYRSISLLGTTLLQQVAACIIVVAIVAWLSTRLLPGYGLRAPLFLPGLTALLCALLFAGGTGITAGVTAFVAGTAGTLLGSGIAQLPRVRDIEIPEISIGGSGMFGAVFLACLLSALIA